jgi:outer membrane scaffolding protein for murein synthesis (MipA/OmpV family)
MTGDSLVDRASGDDSAPRDRGVVKAASGAIAGLFVSVASPAALAADAEAQVPPSAEEFWIATVGAKLLVNPAYPGSDQYTVSGLPVIGLRRASSPERYSAMDDTGGFGISLTNWMRVGVAFNLMDERSKEDDRKLKGLDKVDWTVAAGGFVEIWPTEWLRARAELLKTFNGSDGFIANLGMDAVLPMTDRLSFAFGPRVSIADQSFMQTYYGVTAREAARSRVIGRTFKPDGGIESAGVAASVTYKWDDHWATTVGGGWSRLVGDAARSPITKKIGSENQFWGGVKVSYSFDFSGAYLPKF